MAQKKPKKRLNKYIVLTGIGLQMGITIYVAAQFGKWLDARYTDNNGYTITLTLLGITLSFYSLLRQLKNLEE